MRKDGKRERREEERVIFCVLLLEDKGPKTRVEEGGEGGVPGLWPRESKVAKIHSPRQSLHVKVMTAIK
jgi:hypothetical protein